ncbi:MAG: hypothetical protein WDO70_01685 [Alphaproteobacteria bacterium]
MHGIPRKRLRSGQPDGTEQRLPRMIHIGMAATAALIAAPIVGVELYRNYQTHAQAARETAAIAALPAMPDNAAPTAAELREAVCAARPSRPVPVTIGGRDYKIDCGPQ